MLTKIPLFLSHGHVNSSYSSMCQSQNFFNFHNHLTFGKYSKVVTSGWGTIWSVDTVNVGLTNLQRIRMVVVVVTLVVRMRIQKHFPNSNIPIIISGGGRFNQRGRLPTFHESMFSWLTLMKQLLIIAISQKQWISNFTHFQVRCLI